MKLSRKIRQTWCAIVGHRWGTPKTTLCRTARRASGLRFHWYQVCGRCGSTQYLWHYSKHFRCRCSDRVIGGAD